MKKINLFIAVFTAVISLSGCGRSDSMRVNDVDSMLKEVSSEKWEKLSGKKIFFGHQSIGYNIIDGIKDSLKEVPSINLDIKETKDPLDFAGPLFAHSQVGKNKDPFSKCDDFKKIIDSGVGNKADIAFFKFCYVDIMADTDIDKLFKYYADTMSSLESKYPKVKFIHCTVPVQASANGWKAKFKRLTGLSVWGDNDNIKRNRFNQLMRDKYLAKNTLFDLEELECTFGDGTKYKIKKNKQTFCSLIPAYTFDGGHLNELGRKIAGAKLLLMLQSL